MESVRQGKMILMEAAMKRGEFRMDDGFYPVWVTVVEGTTKIIEKHKHS